MKKIMKIHTNTTNVSHPVFFFEIPREKKNGKMCSYLPIWTTHRRNYMLLQVKKKTIPLCSGLDEQQKITTP